MLKHVFSDVFCGLSRWFNFCVLWNMFQICFGISSFNQPVVFGENRGNRGIPPKQFGPICIHFGCIIISLEVYHRDLWKVTVPKTKLFDSSLPVAGFWGVNLWSERCFWGLVGRGVYRLKKHIYIDIHTYIIYFCFSCHIIWVYVHGAYKNRCHICIDTWCI